MRVCNATRAYTFYWLATALLVGRRKKVRPLLIHCGPVPRTDIWIGIKRSVDFTSGLSHSAEKPVPLILQSRIWDIDLRAEVFALFLRSAGTRRYLSTRAFSMRIGILAAFWIPQSAHQSSGTSSSGYEIVVPICYSRIKFKPSTLYATLLAASYAMGSDITSRGRIALAFVRRIVANLARAVTDVLAG